MYEPLVKKYVSQITTIPPIVVDKDGFIIDGIHRVEATKRNGQKDILAYVEI